MVAEARRRDDVWNAASAESAEPWAEPGQGGGRPGGPVGRMQAELAQRLALAAAPRPVSPEEKLLRLLSVSGGYLALLAAYGCLLFLALR